MPIQRRQRHGFTLVELLVVMGIMALLAGIGVYAYAPYSSKSAVNNGGVLLQSWLNAAKQRALRDQAPRGIRLLAGDEILKDNGTPFDNLVTKCLFIDQQEDAVGSNISGSGKNFTAAGVPAGLTESNNAYLLINGGLPRLITGTGANSITLKNDYPVSIPANSNASFRIQYAPKAIGGADTTDIDSENILRLPAGCAIHTNANSLAKAIDANGTSYALSPATAPIDILFNSSGSVLMPAMNNEKIIFWIAGVQKKADGSVDPMQGQPNAVVVYPRTGLIAGYTIDVGGPKAFVQIP